MVSLYNGQNTNVIASSCFSYSDNSLVMNYKKGIGTPKTQTALNWRVGITEKTYNMVYVVYDMFYIVVDLYYDVVIHFEKLNWGKKLRIK